MAEVFTLRIISPDAPFFEGDCEFLEFTTTEGDIGVYAHHIPLTCILEPCVMTIHCPDGTKKAAVMGGFAEIQKEQVTVLAENAQWPEEIDVNRAIEAKKRAEERLSRRAEGLDVVRAEAALKRAIARLNVAG